MDLEGATSADHADFRKKFAVAVAGSAEDLAAGRVDEMEVTNFKELLIFEPRGFVAYLQAIWHNSFEIVFVLATVGLQLLMPSGYSVCMWLASHSLLISASYRPAARVKWGFIFAGINLLLCIYILARKITFMSGGGVSAGFTCDKPTAETESTSTCHFLPLPGTNTTAPLTDAEFESRLQGLQVWGYHVVQHAQPSQA